ncbi:MAG: prealbumin-like fold domain-containing protein [Schleiferiaceae bacterium]|jgi:hypothetical protein|nr:prealbumin-like fold domain-containing protein [Schleiferiaceae bacterium]
MKPIVLLSSFLFSSVLWSQSSLHLTLKSCSEEWAAPYRSELKIADTLYSYVTTDFKGKAKLKSLPLGTYTLRYVNDIGRYQEKAIEIKGKGKIEITICTDSIEYETTRINPVILRLENGDSLKLKMWSFGCFHRMQDSLYVHKENNQYFLSWDNEHIEMSHKDIEFFASFEYQMRMVQGGGCTTTDSYDLTYKGEQFFSMDGGCHWNGIQKLQSYFKKKE